MLKPYKTALAVLFTIPFSCYAKSESAQETLKNEFKQAYQAYQTALEGRNWSEQRALADKSYQLGCRLYGENSLNCAALRVNYAKTLSRGDDKITPLFEKTIALYKKEHGENSVAVADLYVQLAEKQINGEYAYARSLKKALEIAEQLEDKSPLVAAGIKLEAGKVYLSRGNRKSSILIKAYDAFSELLDKNDNRLVMSRTWLAKYYRAKQKASKSAALLEQNIEVFESLLDFSHPLELVNRASLVDIYETKRQSEKATKHCIAIGEMRPWNDNQEQLPLFRMPPKYPINAARKGKEGWVRMSFAINEYGFVKEPKVIESTSSLFEKASLKALEQWRFAPKFENGVAVRAENQTVQLDFKMGRR